MGTPADHGVLYSRYDLDKHLADPEFGFARCQVCGGRSSKEREGRPTRLAPSLPRSKTGKIMLSRRSSAWLERRSFKPMVQGSNPCAGTTVMSQVEADRCLT